jgi:hypothetical protein
MHRPVDPSGLTAAWTTLKPHAKQIAALKDKRRLIAIAAGRGSGKTEISLRKLVACLPVPKPWPDPRYFFAGPTLLHAAQIGWERLLRLTPSNWLATEPNRQDFEIRTIFGSTLRLFGLNGKTCGIEGGQWDGGVADESSYVQPGVFATKISPALIHRSGWFWQIGVPKRYGVGAPEFKKTFDIGISGQSSDVGAYTWKSADILSPDQLAFYRRQLSPKDYAEQLEAEWVSAGGLVFYAFREQANVRECEYHPDQPLSITCDFNVNPMAWLICHRYPDRLEVIDELFEWDQDTRLTLDILWGRWGDHRGLFEFFGDAAGNQRHTSSGTFTDWAIIANDKRFQRPPGREVYVGASNPAVRDRFASTNALMLNNLGERRLFISPRCNALIADLKNRAYKDGTNEPIEYGSGSPYSHLTDALGYLVHSCYGIELELDDYSDGVIITNGGEARGAAR